MIRKALPKELFEDLEIRHAKFFSHFGIKRLIGLQLIILKENVSVNLTK